MAQPCAHRSAGINARVIITRGSMKRRCIRTKIIPLGDDRLSERGPAHVLLIGQVDLCTSAFSEQRPLGMFENLPGLHPAFQQPQELRPAIAADPVMFGMIFPTTVTKRDIGTAFYLY
jgi:hypothetical protein